MNFICFHKSFWSAIPTNIKAAVLKQSKINAFPQLLRMSFPDFFTDQNRKKNPKQSVHRELQMFWDHGFFSYVVHFKAVAC